MIKLAKLDSRVGASHLKVPGPDGDFGFGGHCFPKDLAAMIRYAELNRGSEFLLKAVNIANHDYRTDKDWEKMKGKEIILWLNLNHQVMVKWRLII